MSQKSEDSIERFFRKGVVQQDKTFMERDWQSMEKMLDDQAMTAASARAGKSKVATRVGVGVVLISFLFLIGVEKGIPENTVQMQAAVGALGPRTKVKNENPTADLHSSDHTRTIEAVAENSVSQKTIAIKKTLRAARQKARPKTTVMRSEGSDSKKSSNKILDKVVIPTSSVEPIEEGSINSDILEEKERTSAETFNRNEVSSDEKNTDLKSADTEAEQEKVESESLKPKEGSELIAKTEETPVKKSSSKFNISALISPDFSTTSLTKYSKPSGVFGVLVGYKILPRFTVMAGATKSLKRYEGYGKEYSPPEGYWQNRTNGVVPDEVEGQCGIIEVPLMVQYDMLQKSKSRVFVSAGVSSYFMRSEHYQYTFNEPNPGAANSWTAKEPSDYVFKIGHLSAGYDRLIGRGFTIGIEPFLKVPFEGIGWTDINLYSTGAYINLRYNILRFQQY